VGGKCQLPKLLVVFREWVRRWETGGIGGVLEPRDRDMPSLFFLYATRALSDAKANTMSCGQAKSTRFFRYLPSTDHPRKTAGFGRFYSPHNSLIPVNLLRLCRLLTDLQPAERLWRWHGRKIAELTKGARDEGMRGTAHSTGCSPACTGPRWHGGRGDILTASSTPQHS